MGAQQDYWQKQEAKKKNGEAEIVVMSATAALKDAVAKFGENAQQSLEAKTKLDEAKAARAQVKKAYHTSDVVNKGTMAGGIRTVETADGKLKITVPSDKVKKMKKNPLNKMADAAAKAAGKQKTGKGLAAINKIKKEAKKEIKAAQQQAKQKKKEAKKAAKAVAKAKAAVKKVKAKEKKEAAKVKAAKAKAKAKVKKSSKESQGCQEESR